MTDQHPLTDEIMYELHGNKRGYSNPFDADDMRAAYDLAVDKAVDEFGYALYVLSQNHGDILDKQDRFDLVREFREAMYTNTTTQQYVETPKDRLKRLIEEGAATEKLIKAFNQLEDN